MKCKYCDKECKNENSHRNHERLCPKNPKRIVKRNFHKCQKCKRNITTNNFEKHFLSCDGVKKKKIRGVDFDPNIGFKNGTRSAWNKGLTKETDERVKKGVDTLIQTLKDEPNIGHQCSFETRQKLSINACNRLAKNSKYSKNINYNGIVLESTYEVALAKILDGLKIEWNKCNGFKRFDYIDLKGIKRNYVPDLYLPKYDIYFDPKNDYLIIKDSYKISEVIRKHKIRLYVLSEKQITNSYILSLLRL